MKNNCLIIVSVLSFLVSLGHAQTRYSADSYLADPEKYENQRVTIYINSVDVPAINSSSEDEFRIFRVSTLGQEKGEFSYGGSIYVKVPKSDAAAFAKRHNNKSNTPKNVSGTFKKWELSDGYQTTLFSYYIDFTK